MTQYEQHFLNHPPDHSTERMIEWARSGTPFIYTKMGDGEIACLDGEQGVNCDGQNYSPELKERLSKAYDALSFQQKITGRCIVNPWGSPCRILHHEGNDQLAVRDFWLAVRNMPAWKVYVGPAFMHGVVDFLQCSAHVAVPATRAFDLDEHIRRAIIDYWKPGCCVIFTAGLASKCWIGDIASSHSTCLDAGSALDPLFRGKTRTHQLDPHYVRELYRNFL